MVFLIKHTFVKFRLWKVFFKSLKWKFEFALINVNTQIKLFKIVWVLLLYFWNPFDAIFRNANFLPRKKFIFEFFIKSYI